MLDKNAIELKFHSAAAIVAVAVLRPIRDDLEANEDDDGGSCCCACMARANSVLEEKLSAT